MPLIQGYGLENTINTIIVSRTYILLEKFITVSFCLKICPSVMLSLNVKNNHQNPKK